MDTMICHSDLESFGYSILSQLHFPIALIGEDLGFFWQWSALLGQWGAAHQGKRSRMACDRRACFLFYQSSMSCHWVDFKVTFLSFSKFHAQLFWEFLYALLYLESRVHSRKEVHIFRKFVRVWKAKVQWNRVDRTVRLLILQVHHRNLWFRLFRKENHVRYGRGGRYANFHTTFLTFLDGSYLMGYYVRALPWKKSDPRWKVQFISYK
jgi:hypothetical protein